jgi:hypothetical protein
LEARICGLEQTTAAILDVLSQLLEAVRSDAPEGDKRDEG